MSSIDDKLQQERTREGRARSSLKNLRNRRNGPQEKWKKPPELIFVMTADQRIREMWKMCPPPDGEATMYELIERTPCDELPR